MTREFSLAGVLHPLGNAQASLGKHKEAAATHEAAVEMFYSANGNNYKTAQARLKLAEHRAKEGLVQEAWQVYDSHPSSDCARFAHDPSRRNYELSITAFSQNKYYKPELARARIKAAHFHSSIGNALEANQLFTMAQATLEEASIGGDARALDEHGLARMVRIWSR